MTTKADLAELAEEIIKRAVRDVQAQGANAREAWAWLMLPTTGETGDGWTLEQCCWVLETEPESIRRKMVARGYSFPPTVQTGSQCEKVPGLINCRKCGTPVSTPDIRSTRTCAACGDRLQRRYLTLRGHLSPQSASLVSPRRTHAAAAIKALLEPHPLPSRYVWDQLTRSGFAPATVKRAQKRLGVRTYWTPTGHALWALPATP